MPKKPERLVAQAPFRFLAVLVQLPHLTEEDIINVLIKQGHIPRIHPRRTLRGLNLG